MLDKVKKNWNLLHFIFMFTKRTKAQGCHMVRKSGKTKKNDKSQVKKVRFYQFKLTKFLIFKSLRIVKS